MERRADSDQPGVVAEHTKKAFQIGLAEVCDKPCHKFADARYELVLAALDEHRVDRPIRQLL